ncbi:hypothetical protein KY290_021770 [Solanum tuberosum]|uniref:Uncharacterized protein n=1 Tax=Solanum tuberosum TaxID=4113 RepID=A0ABQ7V2G3_SOLTU|nr:hypothetical protein KY289_020933 [Solanum tuberosum]KAH0758277.1 hypothetical protein KY290_021770 [Solanum tuberosum]
MNLRHQLNAVQEMPMQFHMVHFRHTSIKSSILRFFICLAKVSNPKNNKLHLPIGGSLYTGMVKGIGRENQGLYHLSRSSSKSSFDMLHCDIWGPYRVPSHNNKRVYTPCNIPYPRNTRDGNGAGRMWGGEGLRLCRVERV